jgi:hypothetical protein
MKVLVRFSFDCRDGTLCGLFVCNKNNLEKLYGKYVYFGEMLGNNSDVQGDLEKSDFIIESEDQEFIKKLVEVLGYTISGINPFYYVDIDD